MVSRSADGSVLRESVYWPAQVTGKAVFRQIPELLNSVPPRPRPGATACRLGGLALLLVACAPVARADGPWNASFGVTSNYILRGVSQTYGGAAVQLGGGYQSSLGWFAGAWGSNADPYPSGVSSKELDLYAGYTRALGDDLTARVAYTHYGYLSDPRPTRYDYNEFALTATYIDRLALTFSYSPDSTEYSRLGFARHKPTFGLEANGRWPLTRRIALTGGAGYYDLHRLFGVGYWAGSVGLAYVDRHFEVDVARYFSDRTVERLYEDGSADGVVAVSAVVRF